MGHQQRDARIASGALFQDKLPPVPYYEEAK